MEMKSTDTMLRRSWTTKDGITFDDAKFLYWVGGDGSIAAIDSEDVDILLKSGDLYRVRGGDMMPDRPTMKLSEFYSSEEVAVMDGIDILNQICDGLSDELSRWLIKRKILLKVKGKIDEAKKTKNA